MQLLNIACHSISNSYEMIHFYSCLMECYKYEICFLLFWYRNEDLKQMLESNKDSAKLDAMKRIVGVGKILDFWKMDR
jgi:hypothetical protein